MRPRWAPRPCMAPRRRAGSASTTGASRQVCTWVWSACARRVRRAVRAVTARTYAWNTICWAGVGQPTSLSQRRGAGPQGARPAERIACRRRKALSRHLAALRARMASSRARHTSRMASSSPLGTWTGVRSPERSSRASLRASRRVILTRSPGLVGSNEGATTQQTWPVGVRER